MAMPSPPPMVQKRAHDNDDPTVEQSTAHLSIEATHTTPFVPQPLDLTGKASTSILPNGCSRQPSPTASSRSALTTLTATPPPGVMPSANATNGPPPKRRKLTLAEREQQQVEKEARAREKEEKKAEREAEKAAKDEERRQKNEEREDKRRQKDLELQRKEQERLDKKRQKEAEKQRDDEERQKKERAQPRLFSFYKPAAPSNSPAKPCTLQVLGDIAERHRSPSAGVDDTREKASANPMSAHIHKSDYERFFLPYQTPLYGRCAPINPFSWDDKALAFIETKFDQLKDPQDLSEDAPTHVRDAFELLPRQLVAKGFVAPSTAQIMRELEGSTDTPTQHNSSAATSRTPLDTLRAISMKILLFDEDVRPPYIGTYTKARSRDEGLKLARNPFARVREELDYDYDSEAEWEEPEEGEDLDSEGESDSGSEAPDEMEDFLDDEDALDGQRPRKRVLAGDMDPIMSGICFEDEKGKCISVEKAAGVDLGGFRLEALFQDTTFPIDPFAYKGVHGEPPSISSSTAKDSPRLPLQAKTTNNLYPSLVSLSNIKPGPKSLKPPKLAPKLLSGMDLEQFKRAVDGSDLPKVGLLGVLKSQFRKIPNEVLKDTLEAVAQRVGQKRDDKKWVIVQ